MGVLRDCDQIARVGGDEFATILSNPVDSAEIAARAARIISSTAPPYSIGGNEIHVTASMGHFGLSGRVERA